MTYTSMGKEVLRDDAHFADTTSNEDAARIAGLLNGGPAVETDAHGEAMICTGCGTSRTLAAIRATKPSAISCCPERQMVSGRDLLEQSIAPVAVTAGELLPCPFCGGEAEIHLDRGRDTVGVGCKKCTAAMVPSWSLESESWARRAWNTRPALAQPRAAMPDREAIGRIIYRLSPDVNPRDRHRRVAFEYAMQSSRDRALATADEIRALALQSPPAAKVDVVDLPAVEAGYKRQWVQCATHGRVGYYDFVPYSLSNPIRVMACGCDAKGQRRIEEDDARDAIAMQRQPAGVARLLAAVSKFAGIIGKASSPATVSIGNDSWSGLLKGADFNEMRAAYYAIRHPAAAPPADED